MGSSVVAAIYKHTQTTEILWRKRVSVATLSRGGLSDPCLDRLLLLFWAPYIKDGPHLLCIGLFWVVILQTTKERMSLNTSKRDICNVKGEMVKTGYAPYLEGLAQTLGR